METKIIIVMVAVLALISLSCAAPINLDGEDLYCQRYGISFWCSESGVELLENMTGEERANLGYINEYAFGDSYRYTGDLKITDISVAADVQSDSEVIANYTIMNSGDSTTKTHIVALQAPQSTLLIVDGNPLAADPQMDGFDLTLAPGEEKKVTLQYTEPVYGDIFGYNINLLFDQKTVDNQITKKGTFKFTLPSLADIKTCAPKGYTTEEIGSRIVVSWKKEDFVPWTNPFSDLVCTWFEAGDSIAITSVTEGPQQEPDNTWLYAIIIVIILFAAVYVKKFRK